jgi:hypothetical protein
MGVCVGEGSEQLMRMPLFDQLRAHELGPENHCLLGEGVAFGDVVGVVSRPSECLLETLGLQHVHVNWDASAPAEPTSRGDAHDRPALAHQGDDGVGQMTRADEVDFHRVERRKGPAAR